jgi:hypothetical protein
MDEPSLLQVRSLWPDVAAPFSRIVPDGCVLARTTDDWTASTERGIDALRIRRIELVRSQRCPEIAELCEEAREDAERRGWTPVDEETTEHEQVLELEGVICRIRPDAFSGGALSIAFHQPWPSDAGAPVETSEMFQNLVRKLLRLGGSPDQLVKEVTVDRTDLSRADRVRERVRLPMDPALVTRFGPLGFAVSKEGVWISQTISQNHEIEARIEERGQRVLVEMIKSRIQM